MAKGIYNLNKEIISDINSLEDELQKELSKVYDVYRDKISKTVAKKLPKGMSISSVNGRSYLIDKKEIIAGTYYNDVQEGTSYNEHNYDILVDFAQYQYDLNLRECYLIDSEIKGNK